MSEYEKSQNQGEKGKRQGAGEGRFKGNRPRTGRPDGKKRPEGSGRGDGENRYGNKNRQGAYGARNGAGGNHGARRAGDGRGGRANGSGNAQYASSRDGSGSRRPSEGNRRNEAQGRFEREGQKGFHRNGGKNFRRDGEGGRARRDERRDFRRDDKPRSHSGEERAFQNGEYKGNRYGRGNGYKKDFQHNEHRGGSNKDTRSGDRKDFRRDERYGGGKGYRRDEHRDGMKDYRHDERDQRDERKDAGSAFAEGKESGHPDKTSVRFSDAHEEDARPRRYEGKPYGWRPRDEEGNPLDDEQAEAFLREEYARKRAERAEGEHSGAQDSSSLREGPYSYSPYRSRGSRGGAGRKDSGRPASYSRTAGARSPRPREEKERRVDVSPARKAALAVGRMVRERDAFAQDLIATHIDNSRMSKEDRGFATKLVLGVVSARGTLDEIIDRCLNAPTDVQDNVRDALRIGVYEMYFLGKQPHAAVDEGVELVRTFEPKACGVANFALRKAASMKEEFPFGNPKADLDAFARQYAFPVWLTRRLIADLGLEAACDFMEASNEPAPLFAAVNPILATDAEVRDELAAAHGEPVPVATAQARSARAAQEAEAAAAAETEALPAKSSPSKNAGKPRAAKDDVRSVSSAEVVPPAAIAGCYRLSGGRVLQDGRIKRMLGQGKLFVSDASSQEIAHLALPDEKPESLLEVGAGRATKTLLLQGNATRLWGAQIDDYETLDNREYKTDLLKERTEVYGVRVACAHTGDATKLDDVLPGKTFDVVFVDAPCSGLGTLRRHPEIRWRLSEKSIAQLAQEGLAMLKSAASRVRVGGTLVYSTCTVTHAENNGVVMEFLESAVGKAFKLVPIDGKSCFAPRLQPGSPDAHFAVKMVRTA